MSYRIAPGKPLVTVDPTAIEKDLAAFIDAQGITDQAGWETFLTNLSQAQLLALEKARLKREVIITP